MDQALQEIATVLALSGASQERIEATLKAAVGPEAQRKLTREESDIFAGAVARAVAMMPSFRDAIALMRPFKDHTSSTLYTDKFSRVGIGELFFLDSVDVFRRATLLLHEALHVLNNHFTRAADFPMDPESENIAKDLEINSMLDRHPRTDLSMLCLPSNENFRFPESKSFEQYAGMLKQKGMVKNPDEIPGGGQNSPEAGDQGSQQSPQGLDGGESDGSEPGNANSTNSAGEPSQESKGSSNGDSSDDGEPTDGSSDGVAKGEGSDSKSESSNEGASGIAEIAKQSAENPSESKQTISGSCDHSTSEREKKADEMGIERASSTEQSVARNNTVARIREEAEKSKQRGDRAALQMLQLMELAMGPSKVDWRTVFRSILSQSKDSIVLGRSDYTYRRINRRMSQGSFIFPGMVKYEPSAILGIDTSGSMTRKDYEPVLAELEAIVRTTLRSKDKFRAFCVDAAATEPKVVRSVKELDLRGGGGTAMEVSIKSVELIPLRNQPDIFILATDGGTSWPAFKRELLRRKGKYKVLVLITDTDAFEVAKKTLEGLADVIDVSESKPKNYPNF